MLVRTKGKYAGSSEGEPWLLIKHRDEWSGELDIGEFAPLSVKSEGDFADILSQDNPDVWRSNRPAKTGETGALFERIIQKAVELRMGATKTGATKKVTTKKAATKKSKR